MIDRYFIIKDNNQPEAGMFSWETCCSRYILQSYAHGSNVEFEDPFVW